ncbi:HAD family hydrolase [Paenibacillus sp. YYML68]|uniref:HAD family hydrolase n=1 Tax=Paenibacillus sp. YYML68 TaxID=2909250 RepID=UPI00249022D5|nr:HAD family hydrolase [Paenibacillus sp. YYML68]
MNWLQDIRAILFDLDGTLYQNERFIHSYIGYMVEGTELEVRYDELYEAVMDIVSGRHPIRIGHFYEPHTRTGWTLANGYMTADIHWDGTTASEHAEAEADGATDDQSPQKLKQTEPATQPQMERHMYVGDAWSAVNVVASYWNVDPAKRTEAFMRVREEMVNEAAAVAIEKHRGLLAAIESLDAVTHKWLITNSPEPAAKPFVNYMGLEHTFSSVIFGGHKPYKLSEHIGTLAQEAGIEPQQILSIGDHAWNDLYPIREMGGRTVFISPYESIDDSHDWDARLYTLEELEQLLRALQQARQENNSELMSS